MIKSDFAEPVNLMSARRQELLEDVAGILAECSSAGEMKEIAAFYCSPTGTKRARLQNEIIQRSAMAGQRWGERIGQELEVELSSRPARGACPAFGGESKK